MKLEKLVKNKSYTMMERAVYAYGLHEYYEPYVLNKYNSNYDYIKNVTFIDKLDKAKFINKHWYNIKVSIAKDVIIYTNSYFLEEGNKQQTNKYSSNISEYIDDQLDKINKSIIDQYDGYFVYNSEYDKDDCNELHCVEIKNGKPKFNKKSKEEIIKEDFALARKEENKIYSSEKYVKPQSKNWSKELIHMQINSLLDNIENNKEELVRLSDKLKGMK